LRLDHPLQGIAWMVAGVFLLAVLDALSKHAVSQLSIPVLIAARSAMVLVLLVPWVMRKGGWSALRTRRPGAHLLRGVLAVCSMLAFFESLRLLPLATVIAISFAAPLFMTLLSVPLLKERVGMHRWVVFDCTTAPWGSKADPSRSHSVLDAHPGLWIFLGPWGADHHHGMAAQA
jgi:drug/metabolite transporter (DMT)-like permease